MTFQSRVYSLGLWAPSLGFGVTICLSHALEQSTKPIKRHGSGFGVGMYGKGPLYNDQMSYSLDS